MVVVHLRLLLFHMDPALPVHHMEGLVRWGLPEVHFRYRAGRSDFQAEIHHCHGLLPAHSSVPHRIHQKLHLGPHYDRTYQHYCSVEVRMTLDLAPMEMVF